MAVLSAIGSVTFLPFLADGNHQPISSLFPFGVIVTLIASIAAWPGLRCADAAAGPLEIVIHLGVMSFVVWLAHGRRLPSIVAAAAMLVAFHLTGGALEQPARIVAISIAGNGVIGLALGWIYSAFGFEFVILGHAVAHLITVLGGAFPSR